MKTGPSLFVDFTLMKMTPQQDDCDGEDTEVDKV